MNELNQSMATPSSSTHKKFSVTERVRASTDSEIHGSTPQSSYAEGYIDYRTHKDRLYQLFTLIEREFDVLYAENHALRARIGLTDPSIDSSIVTASEVSKPSRKAIQVGQKLRTALGRRPQGRLGFKVGGGDNQRMRIDKSYVGHRDGVWNVTNSHCMNIVVSASADHTSRIWSLETGEYISTYVGHTGSVNCVAISPSASEGATEATVASGSGDETVHLWKTPLSSEKVENEGDEKDDDENTPHDQERKISSPIVCFTGHSSVVSSCKWMTSGSLVTASWDRTAKVYDVDKGEVSSSLTGHELELTSCATHPSQKLVVTASKDCTFRLWDLREPMQSVAVLQAHNLAVTCVAFSSTDKIVSGSDDRTLKVWEMRNMRSPYASVRMNSAPNDIDIGKSNGLIATPLDNSYIGVYDLNGQRVVQRKCHSRMATSVSWIDSTSLVSASFDARVLSWKLLLKDREDKT